MFGKVAVIIFCIVASAAAFFTSPRSMIRTDKTSLSMATYKVRLIDNKKGSDVTFECPSNKFILDEAEIKIPAFIPWSCRAGSCSSCIGLLTEGTVDQSSQIFLDNKQIDKGYVLTCVAYPQSDCTIVVNCEDEFYNSDVKPL